MAQFKVVEAKYEHITAIANNLRGADERFLHKYCSDTMEDTIMERLSNSDFKYCLLLDGKPVMLAGVTRPIMITNTGYSWLIGTNMMKKHRIAIARITRKYIRKFKENYDKIIALVDPEDETSVRWHEWVGFELNLINHNGLEYYEARLG